MVNVLDCWSQVFGNPKQSIGTTWGSLTVKEALEEEESNLFSPVEAITGQTHVHVAFRNATSYPVILCRVIDGDKMVDFHTLEPFSSATQEVGEHDHVVNSPVGNLYCFKDLHNVQRVIGAYRINQGDESVVHVVKIQEQQASLFDGCIPSKSQDGDGDDDAEEKQYGVSVTKQDFDATPIDTTDKDYLDVTIAGWPCRVEEDWHRGDNELAKFWEAEIRTATQCLPTQAGGILRKSTVIYINSSLTYGPKLCKIEGKGIRFHADEDFLVKMGKTADKSESVEVYCASEFKVNFQPPFSDEVGDVARMLLAELCKAFHYKIVEGRYENKDIKESFDRSVENHLTSSEGDHVGYFSDLSVKYLISRRKKTFWNQQEKSALELNNPDAYKLVEEKWLAYESVQTEEEKKLFGIFYLPTNPWLPASMPLGLDSQSKVSVVVP